MNSTLEYINAMRDDLFRVLVLNEPINHRVGYVAPVATTSDTPVNSLGLDYETDVVEDEDNLLIPETG